MKKLDQNNNNEERKSLTRTKLPSLIPSLNLDVHIAIQSGLSGRFLIPPFSVLRTMEREWQRRKKQWLALGIKSEIGRGGNALDISATMAGITDKIEREVWNRTRRNSPRHQKSYGKDFAIGNKQEWENSKKTEKWVIEKEIKGNCTNQSGTSIFDPVLCELMYAWFCPEGGQVIDPFAGGSVRGIVAHYMGRKYWGSELRPEQVKANEEQGKEIMPKSLPIWVCGDAWQKLKEAPDADFIFSCPPYGNLEVYSNLEDDISNIADYDVFLEKYGKIIRRACHKLKQNRFACFVVGNYRNKNGFYHDFVGDTIRLFERSKTYYYNEIILITAIGSLPIRVGKQFSASRKIGKTHQNILIFYKGDPKKIKEIFNENQQTRTTNGTGNGKARFGELK